MALSHELNQHLKGVSMSDELNNEITDPNLSPVEPQEVEVEPDAEPAPAEQQPTKGYDKRISTLTARNVHKDQEIAQLRAENETLKGVQQKPAPTPEIPELPNEDLRFDDPAAYQQGLADYHRAVAAQAVADAQKGIEADRIADEERQAKNNVAAKHKDIVNTYVDNGIKAGISEVKMQANESVMLANQLPQELAEFIYSDANGAQIVDFLADNPEKLQELKSANGGHAYVKLANEIKPQALSTKPTHSSAPDPITPTHGAGSAPSEGLDPLIAGATFE